MQLVVINVPTVEPVSLDEAKAQCRILHNNEDTLIGMYVRAARGYVEQVLNRALLDQVLRLQLDGFPGGALALPRPPAISLTSVAYRDRDGVTQTLDPACYALELDTTGARIVPLSDWPKTQQHPQAVTIDWRAGYGTSADAVPDAIRHAILLLIEHYYNNRGATSEGTRAVVPFSVDHLLSAYRTTGWI